jgi:hypothetical protein
MVAERPKPSGYGTGEKEKPKEQETSQPGSQGNPSQSKQTPYRKP